MDKPTEARVKEFWEWCGLCVHDWKFEITGKPPIYKGNVYLATCSKCGESLPSLNERGKRDYENGCTTPPIDLNNLFKYAVPKLFKDGQGGIEIRYYPARLMCVLTTQCEAGFEETETGNEEFDPALALFWAIWGVIHGNSN